MRYQTIMLCLLMAPILCCGQHKPTVDDFFKKYKQDDRAEHLRLGGLVMDLAVSFSEDEEEKEILKKIKRLRLLSFDDSNPVTPKEYEELMKGVQADRYAPLFRLSKGGEKVDILVQEHNNLITDVLLIVYDTDEFIFLNLEGRFRFEDLNDLDVDVHGGEHLKKLPEKRTDLPRA